MFFLLSKILGYLTQPVVQLAILLLLGLFISKAKWKQLFRLAFLSFFFLYTNPFIANELMKWWEYDPILIAEIPAETNTAVLLSGIAATDQPPFDRVHLHKGADRIMHPVQLYKEGKLSYLIAAGGSGKMIADSLTEAGQMKRVMRVAGIPDTAILLEENSRNTFENAQATARLLQKKSDLHQPVLLVTSAFHMRRAKACFDKVGVPVVPFSVDFYATYAPYTPDGYFVPSQGALDTWKILMKEWVGLLAYKLMGYV